MVAVTLVGVTSVVLLDRPDDASSVCIAPTEPAPDGG
jgi:hypothetical protein